MEIRSATLRVISFIENLPSRDLKGTRRDSLAPPTLSKFRRMTPLGFGIPDDPQWLFDPQECTPGVIWPLNVALAVEDGDGAILTSMRTIDPKSVRGRVKRFSKNMVRIDHAQMVHGRLTTASGVHVWMGDRWLDANLDVTPASERKNVFYCSAVALRQRYEWAVAVGLKDSPSVRFQTDAFGMKELFKVRDLPEGKDRRAALMTWVSDHWRQNRHDPEVEIYVRKHIRGEAKFSWKGLDVEILPAQFDLDQRNKLITDRENMRGAGLDRRVVA